MDTINTMTEKIEGLPVQLFVRQTNEYIIQALKIPFDTYDSYMLQSEMSSAPRIVSGESLNIGDLTIKKQGTDVQGGRYYNDTPLTISGENVVSIAKRGEDIFMKIKSGQWLELSKDAGNN